MTNTSKNRLNVGCCREWRTALVALLLASVFCCAFDFSKVQRVILGDFRSRGTHENGKLSWELHGTKAEVRGPKVDLKELDLIFHLEDGEKVRVASPACSFNQATQMGESDEVIHVESQAMVLDGVGYDVLADAQKIRIRSKVRMVIRREAGSLKGADPFAGLGKPERASGKDASRKTK